MKTYSVSEKIWLVFLAVLMILSLSVCGGGGSSSTPSPLSADNINLIFVVTPAVAHDPLGDINPATANLNNQGLQRSLLLAPRT